jgi:transposase InsO family protein
VLDRYGLVHRRKRRRYKAEGTELQGAVQPNGLWCADYKGEFMLGNRQYCYPLTITDYHSRYLLACEGLQSTKEPFAFTVFERVFKEFGLPNGIRTDNGLPFSSPNALFGLSRLSVWWDRPCACAFEVAFDWAGREREFRRAIELNPSYAMLIMSMAIC